ncbi:MAG: TonB-dependent receptor [Thermomonas sp.]|uniref:TonB-dependent receptor n=1 Tax=Thermomonas sp. TaxID=1971895 RepID=UPI0039E54632
MSIRPHHRKPCTRNLIAAAIAVALSSACVAASAQEAKDTPPHQPTELDAITVTAQKRVERLQDVAMSVSVVDARQMADQGAVQLTDYFAQVPGLSLNARGSGRTQLVMRGIATATEQSPTVGVVIDDVPFGSSTTDIQAPDLDPSELTAIEALRGPQGTLYGASSLGGLLKYVTVQPDPQAGFSGRVQADVSSTAHGGIGHGVRAAINVPAGESFALRVSAFDRTDAGYIYDQQQDKEEVNEGRVKGARVAARWLPAENITIDLGALAQDAESQGTPAVGVYLNGDPVYGKYTRRRLGMTDIYDGKVRLYNLKVNADLGSMAFDSITAFGEYEHDGPQDVSNIFGGLLGMIYGISPRPGVIIDNRRGTEKWSQEFRFSSQGARTLDWQLGGYWTREQTEGYQALRAVDAVTGVDLGFPPAYTATAPSNFNERAVYGDIDYHFSPRFDLQLGGRYSVIGQSSFTDYDGPMNGGASTEVDPDASEKKFTFLISPRFKLGENSMFYGRVASGYRAGGHNNPMPGTTYQESYDSDNLVSYEAGYKASSADGRVTVEVAAYYIDWTDIQLSILDAASEQTYYTNGGKASSTGLEWTAQWRVTDKLRLGLNGAYSDAKLEQDLPAGTVGKAGDRLPYSPRFSGSLTADYSVPVGSLYAFVGGSLTHVGSRLSGFSSSAAVARFDMPAYTTADLRAGIEGDQWNVTAYLRNATDAYSFLTAISRSGGEYGVTVIRPRTVGVSVSWNF